jgi:hypothetical protein
MAEDGLDDITYEVAYGRAPRLAVCYPRGQHTPAAVRAGVTRLLDAGHRVHAITRRALLRAAKTVGPEGVEWTDNTRLCASPPADLVRGAHTVFWLWPRPRHVVRTLRFVRSLSRVIILCDVQQWRATPLTGELRESSYAVLGSLSSIRAGPLPRSVG